MSFQLVILQVAISRHQITVTSRLFFHLDGGPAEETYARHIPVEIITARVRLFLIARTTFKNQE